MESSPRWLRALSAGSVILLLSLPSAASAWTVQKWIDHRANEAPGRLMQPGPLEVDSSHRLLVLSTEGAGVHRQEFHGWVEQLVPGTAGEHSFDLTVDEVDTVYVKLDDVVNRISSSGVVDQIDFGGHALSDLEAHGAGFLLATVVETGSGELVLLERSPGGAITELLRSSDVPGTWLDPAEVRRDAGGNLYLLLFTTDQVLRIAPGGSVTGIIGPSGDGSGNGLSGPTDVGFDLAGNVYVAGGLSHNVFRVEPGGVVTEIIDETGDGLGNGLAFAGDLAVSPEGEVFVRGAWSENLFHIALDGSVTELSDESVIDNPQDLAFDPELRALYVSGFDPDWDPFQGGFPDSVYRILQGGSGPTIPALSPVFACLLVALLSAAGYRSTLLGRPPSGSTGRAG